MSSTITGLVREMRPWQWYKQSIMFIGIIFAGRLRNPEAWFALFPAVVAMTALVSASYIFNDIRDWEADRAHPKKRNRPVASGQVSVPVASVFGAILLVGGLVVAAGTSTLFLLVVGAYVGQNILYSVVLKRIVLVDVFVVALGFVLRAVGGVVAIDAVISPWLVICTFLMALVLALGKRHQELAVAPDPEASRDVLGAYTQSYIEKLLILSMAVLLMSYSLYTVFSDHILLTATVPFTFFGVFRFQFLLNHEDTETYPKYIVTDRQMLTTVVLWSVAVLAILYTMPASSEVIP